MTIALSQRAQRLATSASMAAQARVVQLQAEGRQILDFTIGEPDLDTPAHILAAAQAAMQRGDTHYTASAGIAPLRAAIAEKISVDTALPFDASQIALGAGAKQLIAEALAATLEAGDEVIIPVPAWVSYADLTRFYQGVPVTVATHAERDFKLTPDALAAAITPKTRWLIVNAPGNPGGGIYTVAEQQALAEVLAQHSHVLVMTDDIYEHLAFDGQRHVNLLHSAPELAPRTLLVNGFSKAYAMTGWRVGYAAGPQALIAAIVKLIGQSKGGVILESLDGKKNKTIVNLATTKMATLEDVTVYGEEKDIRLADIMEAIKEKEDRLPDSKADEDVLRAFFREVAPTHNESRVYASDIKKIVSWYGIIKALGVERATDVPA